MKGFILLFLFLVGSAHALGPLSNQEQQQSFYQSFEKKEMKGLEEGQEIKFTCVTSLPTTSFVAETTDSHVVFKFIHHNGIKWAPIHTGTITREDFKYLDEKAKEIHRLGQFVEIKFPKENCEIGEGRNEFRCHSNKGQRIGDVETKSFGFNSSRRLDYTYGMEFESFLVNFYFRESSMYRDMRMPYPWEECEF